MEDILLKKLGIEKVLKSSIRISENEKNNLIEFEDLIFNYD